MFSNYGSICSRTLLALFLISLGSLCPARSEKLAVSNDEMLTGTEIENPSSQGLRSKRQVPSGPQPFGPLMPAGMAQAQQCPMGSFRCFNGQCIRFSCVCDGKPDCIDGSDERFCNPIGGPNSYPPMYPQIQQPIPPMYPQMYPQNQQPMPMYPPQPMYQQPPMPYQPFPLQGACNWNEFQCRSGHCLAFSCVCNGNPECPDGSDEANCQAPTPAPASPSESLTLCADGKFLCKTGQCIDQKLVCNKVKDCPYGEDELLANCPNRSRPVQATIPINSIPNPVLIPVPRMNICGLGSFQCRNGQCIPQGCVCDGKPECLDYSDEMGCPSSPLSMYGKKK